MFLLITRGKGHGVAPRASGLGASAIGQLSLAGQQLLQSNPFQDFSLFVYICMYTVLTFQTWMVLYISVNCLLFLSPYTLLEALSKWGPNCFLFLFSAVMLNFSQ